MAPSPPLGGPGGRHDLRLRGVPFAELWSCQPQVFDGAYLLVTRFESELGDGFEAARELQAEGYFVERMGGGAFLCRGDGVAVLHDLQPHGIEFFRLSGPLTREDFRKLRVTHGRPRVDEDFFRALGASLYVLWHDGDRGLVCLADDDVVDELLLFTVQLGLFGKERLLTASERDGLLRSFRPILEDRGILVERTVVHAGGDVEAAVIGWFPDEELFDPLAGGCRVPQGERGRGLRSGVNVAASICSCSSVGFGTEACVSASSSPPWRPPSSSWPS